MTCRKYEIIHVIIEKRIQLCILNFSDRIFRDLWISSESEWQDFVKRSQSAMGHEIDFFLKLKDIEKVWYYLEYYELWNYGANK